MMLIAILACIAAFAFGAIFGFHWARVEAVNAINELNKSFDRPWDQQLFVHRCISKLEDN